VHVRSLFALLALGVSIDAAAQSTITLHTDETWSAFDPAAASTLTSDAGAARLVCLTDGTQCPSGAMKYWSGDATGYGGTGLWNVYIDPATQARWIWSPTVTPDTTGAENAEFFFVKAFSVPGTPVSATVTCAADDLAELYVNGTAVAQRCDGGSALNTLDVGAYLRPGANMFVLHAQNGPKWFSATCSDTCTYSQNPAAVVLYGTIQYQP